MKTILCCDILASLNSVLGATRDSEFIICPMQPVITAFIWEWIAAATAVLEAVLLAAGRTSQCSPKDINKHSDARLPWRRLSCCLGTSAECRPQHLVGAPYVPRKWSDCRPNSLLQHTTENRVVSPNASDSGCESSSLKRWL